MTGTPEAETLRLLIGHNQSYADLATLVVVVGLLVDIAVIFWYTTGKSRLEIIWSAIGTAIIIFGVYGEYHFGSKAAQGNARLQEILGTQLLDARDRLTKAEDKLRETIRDVGDTKRAAEQSAASARQANSDSRNAKLSAGEAISLARGARQEAESFEKDIVSAKTQAADAESHLAEALRRAAEATAELNRFKLPRSLADVPKLVSILAEFNGSEYKFSSVFMDNESIELLIAIDDVLQRAGWKRVDLSSWPLGIPIVDVSGKHGKFKVVGGLSDGVRVSVELPSVHSEQDVPVLQSLPPDKMPILLRKAMSLNNALCSSLFPPEPSCPVLVSGGESKILEIAIGKKP
jgi:hypothetical protein